jgi:hypothetical protein
MTAEWGCSQMKEWPGRRQNLHSNWHWRRNLEPRKW